MKQMKKKPLGLYIHIPFCQAKCAYCDFYSMSGSTDENMRRYSDSLLLQMEDYSKAAKAYTVDTVFIGGGTPTILPIKYMTELIEGIYRHFDVSKHAEFTLEANPATVSLSALSKYRKLGVSRLSLGLQSANSDELTSLSRIHSRSDFETSYIAARKAGFENINVDIMYGIPMQTLESFTRTLDFVTALTPEHISMYGLKIEDGTPFAKQRDTLILPDEDTEADMYFDGIRYLEAKGYQHYEISNFALPGYECRHNLKYWNCDEYLGLGAAAHSYFGNLRFSFKRDMSLFIENMEQNVGQGTELETDSKLVDELYTVEREERIGEYIMLRLRLANGVSASRFQELFGINFDALYGRRLKIYIDNGFMTYDGDRYAFTPQGMYVSNYILSTILDFDENSHIINSIADGSDK
ncbi:MAG: radical SAM family heme chaperone HemW [Clostridiales bacterium]|nr:radical SAM family heme chaperone HemW [Clostridiales bacterium]